MNELREIINSLNDIIKTTSEINSKYSTIKPNRELLRKSTKELKEVSEKIGKIIRELGNTQLEIIAKKIEELQELQSENEHSNKNNQEVNYELLKGLAEQLDKINDDIQTKENIRVELEEKIEKLETKENIKLFFRELEETLPPTEKAYVLKELSVRGLTPITIDNLDKAPGIKEVLQQTKLKWQQLKYEKTNQENILKFSSTKKEEREQIQKRIKELDNELLECLKKANLYRKIKKKIEQLEKIEKTSTSKQFNNIKKDLEVPKFLVDDTNPSNSKEEKTTPNNSEATEKIPNFSTIEQLKETETTSTSKQEDKTNYKVKSIKKPKDKNKIRKSVKMKIAKIAATLVIIATVGTTIVDISSKNKSSDSKIILAPKIEDDKFIKYDEPSNQAPSNKIKETINSEIPIEVLDENTIIPEFNNFISI